jgi:hypothetical protein
MLISYYFCMKLTTFVYFIYTHIIYITIVKSMSDEKRTRLEKIFCFTL